MQNGAVRRPTLGAVLFGIIPFIAMCFSVSRWDRVYPMVLGLPFNLFWLILWILLTPLCLLGAYNVEARARMRAEHSAERSTQEPSEGNAP
jgi:Protein of unknown function (DUF3311)